MISILSLGSSRHLNLKKGSNASYRVALHPGSLTTLAGGTSLEYKYSVPRGEGPSQSEQLLLLFIGSPSGNLDGQSDSGSVSEASVKSLTSVPTSADSGDSELESESEVIEMSLFGNHSTPSGEVNSLNDANVVDTIFDIAEQDSDTINHQLQQVEISSQSEEPKELVPEEPVKTDTHDRSNTTNPDDAEITVIPTEIPCEDNTIKEEVITHQPPPSTLGWIQSVLEKTLIDIKTDIQNLTHEVAGLKNEVSLNANTSSTEQNAIKDRVVRQVAKDLKGMWEQNISATTKISTRINEVVNEFDAAQVKSEALDKSIRKMKADLKSYSNSAFYREDGKLIKEMHSRICPGRILPGEERINNPSPGEPVQTAAEYVKELRNRLTQPNPPEHQWNQLNLWWHLSGVTLIRLSLCHQQTFR